MIGLLDSYRTICFYGGGAKATDFLLNNIPMFENEEKFVPRTILKIEKKEEFHNGVVDSKNVMFKFYD